MARINLLPWREELRKQRQQEFIVALVAALAITGVVVGLVHMNIAGRIEYQNSRNDYVQQQIKLVEKKIREIQDLEKQKKQLIARMKVIEQLQRNRPEIVHLFDELVKLTPEGLHLTTLRQSGAQLVMEGNAQSNARVSAFMRNLDKSDWFDNPTLEVIQTMAGKGVSRKFVLSVTQSSPSMQGDENS